MATEHDEGSDLRKVRALPIAEYSRVLNDDTDPLHAAAKQYSKDSGDRLSRAYMQALAHHHPEVKANLDQATQSALRALYSQKIPSNSDRYRNTPVWAPEEATLEILADEDPTVERLEELLDRSRAHEAGIGTVLLELADQKAAAVERADAADKRAHEAERKARVAAWVAYISLAVTVIIGVVGISVSL